MSQTTSPQPARPLLPGHLVRHLADGREGVVVTVNGTADTAAIRAMPVDPGDRIEVQWTWDADGHDLPFDPPHAGPNSAADTVRRDAVQRIDLPQGQARWGHRLAEDIGRLFWAFGAADERAHYIQAFADRAQHLAEDRDALAARVADLEDLLGYLALHTSRHAWTQLTTEQKEMWADLIDAQHAAQDVEDGYTGTDLAYTPISRWWREDYQPVSEEQP